VKCEDFLPWLETGTWLQRAQANRHAKRCPSCAAAERMLEQVKRELEVSDPLPARLRQQWLSTANAHAAIEPASVRRNWSARSWYLTVALAASLLLALIPLSKWWTDDPAPIAKTGQNTGDNKLREQVAVNVQHDQINVGQISVSTLDGRAQLNELDSKVAALQDELEQLLDRSEQLAVQQQLSQLLASHERWQATGM